MSAFLKKIESETELKYVSPDLLDFDPTNPRFGGLMDKRSQPEIQQELVKEPITRLSWWIRCLRTDSLIMSRLS